MVKKGAESLVAKEGEQVAKKSSFLSKLNPFSKIAKAEGLGGKTKALAKGMAVAAAVTGVGAGAEDIYHQEKATGHVSFGQVLRHAIAGATENVAHVVVVAKDLPGAIVGGDKGRAQLRKDMAEIDSTADMFLKVQHYDAKGAAEKSGREALDLISYDLSTHGNPIGQDALDPDERKADADAAIALAKSMSDDPDVSAPMPPQPEDNPPVPPQPEGQDDAGVADAA